LLSLVLAACGSSAAPETTNSAGEGEAAPPVDPDALSIWSYLPPDDPSVAAYIDEFQQQHPEIEVSYTPFPEDEYQTKINTALSAHAPPDVAIIENKAWMKAGLVVELSDFLDQWGVDPADFNPGGVGRITLSGELGEGIYGIGDFLGGNILVYNKSMFDAAALEYPPADRSLTWPQFAELCRALAKPSRNPAEAVYGCSVPEWSFGIWSKWVFGEDGHQAIGNLNSPEMIEAWNLGTALVREGMAPSASVMEAFPAGESDMFAQGKIAMTWSDFSEVPKYQAQNIQFGLAPFWVISGSDSFVDTWTAPWGTFTESQHRDAALEFLKFIATDAQRIRAQVSADPPFNMAVADELQWGQGDPVKEQYLIVLKQAKPQVFVPPLPEGAYAADEIYRLMTIEGQTDAQPLLDAEAEKTQPLLEEGWRLWEELGQGE
jgi:multiple sugar transport system substrate-binding protein